MSIPETSDYSMLITNKDESFRGFIGFYVYYKELRYTITTNTFNELYATSHKQFEKCVYLIINGISFYIDYRYVIITHA